MRRKSDECTSKHNNNNKWSIRNLLWEVTSRQVHIERRRGGRQKRDLRRRKWWLRASATLVHGRVWTLGIHRGEGVTLFVGRGRLWQRKISVRSLCVKLRTGTIGGVWEKLVGYFRSRPSSLEGRRDRVEFEGCCEKVRLNCANT